MGADISTLLRERLGQQDLKELILDDAFIAILKQAMPPDVAIRTRLEDLLSPGRKLSQPANRARVQRLWTIEDKDVQLHKDVVDVFPLWKQQPATFLSDRDLSIPVTPSEHYQYTKAIRQSLAVRKILWRFTSTVYYKVLRALSSERRSNDALEYAVAVICQSSSAQSEEVRENVKAWAKDGAKYWSVARAVGCTSCYFFLPDIAETIWSKHLTSPEIDRATNLLCKFGITQKAREQGAVDLAHQIESLLLTPFESTIDRRSRGLPNQWLLPMPSSPRCASNCIVERCCNDSTPAYHQDTSEEYEAQIPAQASVMTWQNTNTQIGLNSIRQADPSWTGAEVFMLKPAAWDSLSRVTPSYLNLSIYCNKAQQSDLTVWLSRDIAESFAAPQNDLVLPIPSRNPVHYGISREDDFSCAIRSESPMGAPIELPSRNNYCVNLALWEFVVALRLPDGTLTLPRAQHGAAFCTMHLDNEVAGYLALQSTMTASAAYHVGRIDRDVHPAMVMSRATLSAIFNPTLADLTKSGLLSEGLPFESALPTESELWGVHILPLAEIFTRYNAHGIWGLHLLHRHFNNPPGTVLLGSTWHEPYSRWTTATELDGPNWSGTGGSLFMLTEEGWHPYEYHRHARPNFSSIEAGFLPELTSYILKHRLSNILGLQLLEHVPDVYEDETFLELSLQGTSIMFCMSDLIDCVPTRQTGWKFELHNGKPKVCQYNESHGARPDGGHDVYNQGKLELRYGDFNAVKDALVRDGVLKERWFHQE